jgi:ATP-binding cassette subfamily B protein
MQKNKNAINSNPINKEYTQANLDSILYYAVFFPVVEIIAAIALGMMVWWGARNVVTGSVSMGSLIAFPVYVNMLFRPMRWLADKFNTLQMGMVAAERVFNILDSDEMTEETPTPVQLAWTYMVKWNLIMFIFPMMESMMY